MKKSAINARILKSKMGYHGYNIESLANEMGVSRDTVSNLINGYNYPSYPLMNSLFYVLKLNPEEAKEIFFGERLAP